MKINKLSKAATAQSNVAAKTVKIKTVAVKGAKVASATGKTAKAAVKAVKRVYSGITGRAVLLLEADKGKAFRLAEVSKDGYAQLVQNNVGMKYDGAKIDLLDVKGESRTKQERLELGDYIASKGKRARVTVLSLAEAQKLAKEKHTIERNGKEVAINTFGDVSQHYVASLERFKTGVQHFFQWETARIKKVNAKHYGALIK